MDTTRFLDHLLASARDLAGSARTQLEQASSRLEGEGIAGLRQTGRNRACWPAVPWPCCWAAAAAVAWHAWAA